LSFEGCLPAAGRGVELGYSYEYKVLSFIHLIIGNCLELVLLELGTCIIGAWNLYYWSLQPKKTRLAKAEAGLNKGYLRRG